MNENFLHVYPGGAEHGYHSETAKCAGEDSDRGLLDCPFWQTRERNYERRKFRMREEGADVEK